MLRLDVKFNGEQNISYITKEKKSHFFFHSGETWQNHLNQVTGIHNNDSGTNQPHVLLDRMQ